VIEFAFLVYTVTFVMHCELCKHLLYDPCAGHAFVHGSEFIIKI